MDKLSSKLKEIYYLSQKELWATLLGHKLKTGLNSFYKFYQMVRTPSRAWKKLILCSNYVGFQNIDLWSTCWVEANKYFVYLTAYKY